ncbi:hypothetical protein H6G17_07025 [Chroococcidiopsis sp. FACHB-1243]|uniref:hypothetical protein n=1 Tax=Chroococcidiopsis sp. [FACHB-1243] TaxID=2692781 RepID=UPI00177CE2B6|nr:hypothetical protein [Chroococcidiopsis sp. [FACHB-1243]]MBD2305264.1 hypothetical protein [Chroococcidiopsis sp. [FACHB-1243]]
MNLIFLIPLATCFLTGCLCQKCPGEIAYLTAVIAVISLILSLILAPWQLQLLIILFVFSSTRKLLQQNESRLRLMDRQKQGDRHS